MIPYGRQHITAEDIAAVTEVLQSNWLTQGPAVPAFEQAISAKVQADFAIAVNSATSALHIACLALGVGPGDRVWTSAISFVASANCALYCGAEVDFVDIELETGNISVSALQLKLQQAATNGTLPKVVIPVHFAGQSCDMAAIAELAKVYGFQVIEDASHAIGASYQEKPVGCCQFSDICVFSFHPVKIITSAEGGVATTNQAELAHKMKMLRSHGITAAESEFVFASHGPWYYEQQMLGFNYRMTDLQAALGLSQLSRLDEYVKRRHQLVAHYNNAWSELASATPLLQRAGSYSSYHLYVLRLTQLTREQHKNLILKLREHGITGHLHYIPIYLQPFYRNMGFSPGYCPQAELYYQQAVTLPLYPLLEETQQQRVVQTLKDIVRDCSV
jgi:UDP-4-amino-4,6-dideoxy-N-acetyl-beta-L-altrosamine transaminase